MRMATRARVVCALLASATWLAAPSAQGARTAAPRMAPVPENQRSDEQRTIAAPFASSPMSNAVATYLNYPAMAQALLPHERYVSSESTLPPRHRALLMLRTAWLTRSNYLWAHRAGAARRAGFTEEELRRIAQGPDAGGWDGFEAALLRAADELHVDSFVSDATWRTLSGRYDTNQMIDTVDTVGAYTMHAGALNSLGVEIEAGVPDRLPSGIPSTAAAKRTNLRLLGKEPRIPPVEPQPGARGGGANVFRTFVRNPTADRPRGAVNSHVTGRSTLSARQRELLLMRIGVLCRSEYEYAAHSRLGRQAGMNDADVARIVAGPASGGGDPLETALLKATDELFEDDLVSTDTWASLAKALDARQLLDVLIAVGGYRSTSMLINSAGVQLDANMENFRFPPALR
jgi:4-carboxymuconolactone decarboxylase